MTRRASKWFFLQVVGVVILTAAGFFSLWQLFLSLLILITPDPDFAYWRPRLFIRVAQTIIIGILWLWLVVRTMTTESNTKILQENCDEKGEKG